MAQKKYTIKRTLKLENKDGNMDLSITPTTWHIYTDTYKFFAAGLFYQKELTK